MTRARGVCAREVSRFEWLCVDIRKRELSVWGTRGLGVEHDWGRSSASGLGRGVVPSRSPARSSCRLARVWLLAAFSGYDALTSTRIRV